MARIDQFGSIAFLLASISSSVPARADGLFSWFQTDAYRQRAACEDAVSESFRYTPVNSGFTRLDVENIRFERRFNNHQDGKIYYYFSYTGEGLWMTAEKPCAPSVGGQVDLLCYPKAVDAGRLEQLGLRSSFPDPPALLRLEASARCEFYAEDSLNPHSVWVQKQ